MERRRNGRALVLVVAIVAAAGLAGYVLLWSRPVKAGDIRRDPEAYRGKVVTVCGTVTGGASLGGALLGGGGGFFLLDDGTGQIGVTVEGPAPAKGQRVTVRGEVEIIASLSMPDSWLRALGAGPGAASGFTAVVVRAREVRVR